jgi:nitrite reductase (NADH) large subunit
VIRRDGDVERLVGVVLFGDTIDGLWYAEMIRSGMPIEAIRADLIFGRDFVSVAA